MSTTDKTNTGKSHLENLACSEARDLLLDRAHGELDARDQVAVEMHLDGCAGCRREARELDEDLALLRASERVPPVRPYLATRIAARLAEGETGRALDSPRWWSRPGLVLACVAGGSCAALVAWALALGGWMPAHRSAAPTAVASERMAPAEPADTAEVVSLDGESRALTSDQVSRVGESLDQSLALEMGDALVASPSVPGLWYESGLGWSVDAYDDGAAVDRAIGALEERYGVPDAEFLDRIRGVEAEPGVTEG